MGRPDRERTLILWVISGLSLLLSGVSPLDVDGGEGPVLVPYDAKSLFDYGTSFGDTEVLIGRDLASAIKVPNMEFWFFGSRHDKVYISLNGHISFTLNPTLVYSDYPLPHPHPRVPDPPMAAVFFAESSAKAELTNSEDKKSKIYYRTLFSTDDDTTMLEELGRQVRINAITNMVTFNPTQALIVTWHSLRHDGCNQQSACPRNTFQAAIVTDDMWTYAIYNYKELSWLGGISEGCDKDTGRGPNCFKAQVGFNAGYGRNFHALPGSNEDTALDLVTIKGSKTVGRHIYRVSHYEIIRDACTSAAKRQPLAIYPDSSSMLGGTEVYAAGPCLPEPFPKVRCWVGVVEANKLGVEVEGRVIDAGRVACTMPALTTIEGISLRVKLSADMQYYHEAPIKIDAPHRKLLHVKLHSYRSSWLQRDPPELSLSWPPMLLNKGWLDYDHENGTGTPPGVDVAKVDVLLYGFRETAGKDAETAQREWKLLAVLGNGHANSGQFTFKPADARCTEGGDCDWHLGSIKVQPSGIDIHKHARGLYSGMFPLGWYVEDVMTKEHGDQWPEVMCKNWKDPEVPKPADVTWQSELLPCPCTAAQAYTDKARFIVGADCDTDTTQPVPCPMSPEATVCYVSSTPTPQGAESRCCYNSDGFLLSSADGPNGSYSGRSHEDGVPPYEAPGKVPMLSHWLVDKLPYIWCCLWSTDPTLCMLRYEPQRRTPECSQHKAASTAFAFGDPHFMTFDGTNYTFNGYAEYWLVQVDELKDDRHNFRLQARMQNSTGTIRNLKATIITAVAMQQGSRPDTKAPKVTFLLNPPLALHRVSVYVDGTNYDFHNIATRNFRESHGSVTIYRKSSGQAHSNFTAVTDTGVSVTVAEKAGILQVTTTVPPSYFEKTNGLFGFWDGNPNNDLRRKDGIAEVDPKNTKDVHEKFGVDWTVTESESIFKYFGNNVWQSFRKTNFTPNFIPAFPTNVLHNITKEMVNQKCNYNEFCTFDYMTTLSAPIADASLEAEAWALQSKAMIADVAACPYIYVERSFREPGVSNLAGSSVQLTGCVDGYTLIGSSTFECVQDAETSRWSPQPTSTYCKDNYIIAAERKQQTIAITVPITLLCIAALVAVLVFLLFRKRRRMHGPAGDIKDATDLTTIPRQKPPIHPDPHPPMYTAGSHTSQSQMSLASRGSNNSIILTEQIVPQRPQRPVKTQIPPPGTDLTPPADNPGYDGRADSSSARPPIGATLNPPHGYENLDYPPVMEPEAEISDPRVQYGGTGSSRPMSTVSHFGPESYSRSTDDMDNTSLDREDGYTQQVRKPYHTGGTYPTGGYDNQAAVREDGALGMASQGRFGYQAPLPTHPGYTKKTDTFV